ncbi:MAG: anthranilate phosphoribosyltransferase, partial [Deltaproteobacteria bacterium]|nr:anthranilate phosphoribosyltransferase [Deltaproteobacteria bacterium]
LNSTPEQVAYCIRSIGIGFLYAPALHGAMKHAIGPRREIGIRTIFNILGPLTNPAGADRQVLGVYREELVPLLANVLLKLGCRRGYVVHGSDGMDEITLTGPTRIAEICGQSTNLMTVEPEDFGLHRCLLSDLQGGDAVTNAKIVREILSGQMGPKREVVLLNAAYGLLASGIAKNVIDGLEKGRSVIDNGLALEKLDQLVKLTNS